MLAPLSEASTAVAQSTWPPKGTPNRRASAATAKYIARDSPYVLSMPAPAALSESTRRRAAGTSVTQVCDPFCSVHLALRASFRSSVSPGKNTSNVSASNDVSGKSAAQESGAFFAAAQRGTWSIASARKNLTRGAYAHAREDFPPPPDQCVERHRRASLADPGYAAGDEERVRQVHAVRRMGVHIPQPRNQILAGGVYHPPARRYWHGMPAAYSLDTVAGDYDPLI